MKEIDINQNIYEDSYVTPPRDPREINQVERLKSLQNRKYLNINDEEVQHSELEPIINTELKEYVKLTSEGKIPAELLPDTVNVEESLVTMSTSAEFPEIGNANTLYIAAEENAGNGYLYRWCEEDGCYTQPYDCSASAINSIKVNGEVQEIVNNVVDVKVPTQAEDIGAATSTHTHDDYVTTEVLETNYITKEEVSNTYVTSEEITKIEETVVQVTQTSIVDIDEDDSNNIAGEGDTLYVRTNGMWIPLTFDNPILQDITKQVVESTSKDYGSIDSEVGEVV